MALGRSGAPPLSMAYICRALQPVQPVQPQAAPIFPAPTSPAVPLQELYDKLHAAFSPKSASRPRSGLTMVGTMDSMGSELDGGSDAGGSWWSGLRSAVMGGHGHGRGGGGGSAGSHGSAEPAVKGLYMFGGVGCGKTMLMDLFVDTTPPHWRVVRTHFHDFMLDVHAALRRHEGTADPLARVADDVAAKTQVGSRPASTRSCPSLGTRARSGTLMSPCGSCRTAARSLACSSPSPDVGSRRRYMAPLSPPNNAQAAMPWKGCHVMGLTASSVQQPGWPHANRPASLRPVSVHAPPLLRCPPPRDAAMFPAARCWRWTSSL